MENKAIKAYYQSLLGIQQSIQSMKHENDHIKIEMVEPYVQLVNTLEEDTKHDLSRFKLHSWHTDFGQKVSAQAYKSQVASLIGFLHARYFVDSEPAPFGSSTGSNTYISQSQIQNQTTIFLLNIQQIIDKKLPQTEEGSNENKFLKALNEKIRQVEEPLQLIKTIIELANQFGLTTSVLQNLFS